MAKKKQNGDKGTPKTAGIWPREGDPKEEQLNVQCKHGAAPGEIPEACGRGIFDRKRPAPQRRECASLLLSKVVEPSAASTKPDKMSDVLYRVTLNFHVDSRFRL